MEIHPTPDQQAFIRQAIDAGRIAHPQEAVMQALMLWEDRERRRVELVSRIDEADAALARGEAIAMTPESLQTLTQEVKQRGRARLQAGIAASR